MVGTWSYNPATNVLAVTGATSGAPAGFVDAWNFDKATSRTLKAAAASPFTASLETPVKPADSLALKLSVVITNFSVAGTVTLTGKDAWGNAISETLNITANGTFTTAQYFASIDANGAVAAGTFTAAITQPRLGVVWRINTRQYTFDCLLQIGDGATATYFADNSKAVAWSNFMAYGATVLTVTAGAYFTAGTLLNLANKTTCNGIHFYVDNTSNQRVFMSFNSGSYAYLYSCTFEEASNADFYIAYYPLRVWNCTFDMAVFRYLANADLFNVKFWQTGNNGCFQNSYAGNTMDKIYAYTCSAVMKTDGTGPPSMKNLYARNNAYIVLWNNNQVGAVAYLINPDVDAYLFSWTANASTVYRQYEFDLVTEPGATVVLKRADGTQVFSVTADAVTGAIATQTVTRGYYNTANGNTLQDYGPFRLEITKAGKMPYTDTGIVLDAKTTLHIALRDQLSGTAMAGDVAAGKTFYRDDADSKLSGSYVEPPPPVLCGDAEPKDVAEGKTFYKDDPAVKLTGSHVNPSVFVDVGSGKPVINLNRKNAENQLVFSL